MAGLMEAMLVMDPDGVMVLLVLPLLVVVEVHMLVVALMVLMLMLMRIRVLVLVCNNCMCVWLPVGGCSIMAQAIRVHLHRVHRFTAHCFPRQSFISLLLGRPSVRCPIWLGVRSCGVDWHEHDCAPRPERRQVANLRKDTGGIGDLGGVAGVTPGF